VIPRILRGRLDDAGDTLPRGVAEASGIEDGPGEVLEPLTVGLIEVVGKSESGPGPGAPELLCNCLDGEPTRRGAVLLATDKIDNIDRIVRISFIYARFPLIAVIIAPPSRKGSSALNRGQAARSASSSHLGFLPRHLGISEGGTARASNFSSDQLLKR
jgi:hypothetical protein